MSNLLTINNQLATINASGSLVVSQAQGYLTIQGLKTYLDRMSYSMEVQDNDGVAYLRVIDADTNECFLIRKL